MWFKLANVLKDYWGRKGRRDGQNAITSASFLSKALLMEKKPFCTWISPKQKGAARKTEEKCLPGSTSSCFSGSLWQGSCLGFPAAVCTEPSAMRTTSLSHIHSSSWSVINHNASSGLRFSHSFHVNSFNLFLRYCETRDFTLLHVPVKGRDLEITAQPCETGNHFTRQVPNPTLWCGAAHVNEHKSIGCGTDAIGGW